ncbi:hypothetical protein C0J52_06108 [Blattella germanica]|nr:hypothetical protein C0J52_06108 [Blattella germanica]
MSTNYSLLKRLLLQSEVKEHLNCVIDFVDKRDSKHISAYYSHMRSLRVQSYEESS